MDTGVDLVLRGCVKLDYLEAADYLLQEGNGVGSDQRIHRRAGVHHRVGENHLAGVQRRVGVYRQVGVHHQEGELFGLGNWWAASDPVVCWAGLAFVQVAS